MVPIRNIVSGLSWSCAYNIFGRTPPNNRYAEATARLLIATAAHESGGFRHRRQTGFQPAPESLNGAFGLWQLEWGSIQTTLSWLARNKKVEMKVHDWLSRHDKGAPRLAMDQQLEILGHLQTADGDPYGCVLARCHYLRVTSRPIPDRIDEQAAYWLQYYNGFGCCKVKRRHQPGLSQKAAIELCEKDFVHSFQKHAADS